MNPKLQAATLAVKALTDSEYTNNIIYASRVLAHAGYGDFIYSTQWENGATLWRNPNDEDDTKIVQPTWKKAV